MVAKTTGTQLITNFKRKAWAWLGRTETVMAASWLLVMWAVWSLIAIYGPVVKVEAVYQFKAAKRALRITSIKSLVVPNFTVNTDPLIQSREYSLVIPKLFIEEKVTANVNPTSPADYGPALKVGIAHAAGTALPGNGGLGYYFAHSSGLTGQRGQSAVFYLLGKLEAGDEVFIYREGEKYGYTVEEKRVVEADDLRFLGETRTGEWVVLQTCWPIGTNAKRLLVLAQKS